MEHRLASHVADVQARAPAVHVSPLARRRDRRREGHPDRRARRRAAVLRQARVLRRSRAAAEGRAHVALRGGRQRGDRRGRRSASAAFRAEDARRAHRRARARAPGRAARRGDDRGALPRAQAGAGRRASRRRRSTRCYGSAVATERGTRRLVGVAAQGMTACPCAQELVAGARARAPRRPTASPTTRSSASSRPCPSPRTTSAASARCTSAAPRTCDDEIEARDAAGHRRGLDVVARSTS